jgi:hypothetical protein
MTKGGCIHIPKIALSIIEKQNESLVSTGELIEGSSNELRFKSPFGEIFMAKLINIKLLNKVY